MLWGQRGTSLEQYEKEEKAYENLERWRKSNMMPSYQVKELDSLEKKRIGSRDLYRFLYNYDQNNNGELTHNQRFRKIINLIKKMNRENKCPLEVFVDFYFK